MTHLDVAIEEGIARRLARIREEQSSAVDPKTLRWLALLPEWTDSLANACGFPSGGSRLPLALARAQRARLCETRHEENVTGEETIRFWMPTAVRSSLLEEWQRQAEPRLDEEIEEISRRVLSAYEGGEKVSRGILRWAQLAHDELENKVVTGDTLSHRVGLSLAAGEIGTALDWIFAGESLAESLGARMEVAASRARRRVNLHYRRIRDEDYMGRFVRREEQLVELRALAESDEEWAVHFIGPGGVGKTMLMRFVTSRLGDNPVARSSRVDFDYIDPRVPLESPASLLQELGEGLAIDLEDGTQEALFRSFLEAVREAEAARSGLVGRSIQPIDTPEFDRAIVAFARFLGELPQPVALILDTCEELAKLHPPGGEMPSINAMFDILERLHDAAPGVKMIIAGRRWLTCEYANLVREEAAPESVKAMPPRPYLRMHDVRGFTQAEVDEYLGQVCGLTLDDEMLAAVRENTIDRASAPGLPDRKATDEPRYSPNDVALIGRWLLEDPDLDPKALAEGDFDPYVEARIVERLENDPEVLAALPAVTLLERFDAATIEPALGADSQTRRHVLAGLIAEDWTHLEGGPEAEDIVLKVDAGLLPRLQAYYGRTDERQNLIEDARTALSGHLSQLLEKPPRTATIEGIDAALRLVPPVEAVRAFDRMADRVAREPAWSWAEAVCERLLSPDREPPLAEELVPSVWALYLAALNHRRATVDLGPFWDAVALTADQHPDAEQAMVLAGRGRLGALTAAIGRRPVEEAEVRAVLSKGRLLLDRDGGEAVAPTLLAAAEALVDACDERGMKIPADVIAVCLGRLYVVFEGDRSMQTHVLALAGRMYAVTGDRRAARRLFGQVQQGQVQQRSQVEPLFADWVAPISIQHRAMLELLRFRLANGEEGDGLLDLCEATARERFGGADAAQLLSLTLQARLARGSVTVAQLEQTADYEAFVEGYELTAPAHRCAPPLFVSLAEGWLAVGCADRALRLLAERERLATSRRTDEHATRAAALALVRILRRLRLRERLALVSHSTAGDEELRAEALAAGALIAGLQPTLKRASEADRADHAIWRARILLESAEDEDLFPQSDTVLGAAATPVHMALDRLESELVLQRLTRLRGESQGVRRAREAVEELARHRDGSDAANAPSLDDPLGAERLRLDLRLLALLDGREAPGRGRRRQMGQLALEEGELLALRVPSRAIGLLELAESCFDEVGDEYAAFISSLRAAIAEIHCGWETSARERERQILDRYGALRKDNPALPAPSVLADPEDPAEGIEPDDPWRAWVWRLSFYLQWCDGHKGSPDADSAAMEFGPEFALAPAKGAVQPTLAPRTRARTREIAAGAPLVFRWWPILPGLLVLAAVAVATSTWISVGLIVLALALVVAVEGIGPRLPWRVLPLSGFNVWLLSPPRSFRSAADAAVAGIAVAPWSWHRLMRIYLRLSAGRRRLPIAFVSTGANAATAIETPAGDLAQALRPRLGGGYAPLRLKVDSDLARIPWERHLTGHLATARGWRPERSPQVRRVRPSGFAPLPDSWPQLVSAACSPRWRQFLESSSGGEIGWLDDLGAMNVRAGLLRREAISSWRRPRGQARATIALGLPVVTRAGWRLRLDDDELSGQLDDPSEPRLQQLVSPDRLVREGPVVVVVGRPDGRSLTADKRVSDGLRGLANEVFLAGAHAVITVPVLPPRQAADAIGMLVAEIRGWPLPPDVKQLQHCAEKLRARIYGDVREADEEERLRRVELALDVCLFAPR